MDTLRIDQDLLQFTSYLDPIDLSFNQFLLLGAEPLLVHTGAAPYAADLLPRLDDALGDRDLAYVFASHFESDECGGLGVLRRRYPDVRLLCSEVTAREIAGFGLGGACSVQRPGSVFETPDARLEFLAYPSEVHLWEGLMLFERRRGILFSSDLFGRFGRIEGELVAGAREELMTSLGPDRIPSPPALEEVRQALSVLPVSLVAPGHGPCIRL